MATSQAIWQKRRKTIVFVTHNVREAVCLGDRVVLFSPSPGRIREEFKIPLPRPRDINSLELAAIAQRITRALKGHLVTGGGRMKRTAGRPGFLRRAAR